MGLGTGCAVIGCFIESPHIHEASNRLRMVPPPKPSDPRDERIRTLEEENALLREALQPFAVEGHRPRDTRTMHQGGSTSCSCCHRTWPCIYEKARRALYPDTERTPE